MLTAQDDGRAAASDEQLPDRATELDRVLFSHDSDVLRIAANRQRAQQPFCGVVWVHPETLSIGDLIDQLELLAQLADPEDCSLRVLYLPL